MTVKILLTDPRGLPGVAVDPESFRRFADEMTRATDHLVFHRLGRCPQCGRVFQPGRLMTVFDVGPDRVEVLCSECSKKQRERR